MVNAKLIKIVNIPKFASNSDVVFEIVLMLARNSVVDRMLYAYPAIIDLHVYAVMDLLVIQMISIWVVNRLANVLKCQIYVEEIPTVRMDKCASLEQMEPEIVLILAFQLLVAQTKNAV